MQTTTAVSLNKLRRGQSGIVAQIEERGDITRRLMSMGLLPGVRVTMMSVAPLDDPISLRLAGFELSIRRGDAQAVSVEFKHEPGVE